MGGSLVCVSSPLLHACSKANASSKAAHFEAFLSQPVFEVLCMNSPQDSNAIADATRAAKVSGGGDAAVARARDASAAHDTAAVGGAPVE